MPLTLEKPFSPEDLFDDQLLELLGKHRQGSDEGDIDARIFLASPSHCLLFDVDTEELPQVNQQIDSEIFRCL